jgi:hypothetical protein
MIQAGGIGGVAADILQLRAGGFFWFREIFEVFIGQISIVNYMRAFTMASQRIAHSFIGSVIAHRSLV